MKTFMEEHGENFGSAERAMKQAIENTGNNIKWLDDYYEVITKWLADNGYSNDI